MHFAVQGKTVQKQNKTKKTKTKPKTGQTAAKAHLRPTQYTSNDNLWGDMQMQPEHTEGPAPFQHGLICNDIFRGQMEREEKKTAGETVVFGSGTCCSLVHFLRVSAPVNGPSLVKTAIPQTIFAAAHTMVVSLSMRSSMV